MAKKDKVGKKISTLKDEGYGQDQAVAIALSMKDAGKLANGGMVKGFSPIVIKKQRFKGIF